VDSQKMCVTFVTFSSYIFFRVKNACISLYFTYFVVKHSFVHANIAAIPRTAVSSRIQQQWKLCTENLHCIL